MAASLKMIADQLGLSKAAISLYFKDPATRRVSEENKERIRLLAEQLDYRPNVIARSLSSLKTRTIAILIPLDVPYFRSTFLSEAICGIQEVLFERGYNLIFIPTRGDDSPAILRNQLEQSRGYDGFIIFGTRACSSEDMRRNVEQMLRTRTPFAVLNMPDLGYEINQVVNVTPPASSAIRYLLELGHREIVLMAGPRQAPDTVRSVREYRECFQERGPGGERGAAPERGLRGGGGPQRAAPGAGARGALLGGVLPDRHHGPGRLRGAEPARARPCRPTCR